MGFNTNITICNDNLTDYERDPERFWRLVREGMYNEATPMRLWGITVHSDHADATQLIAAGGNFSTKVHTGWYVGSHHTKDGQVALLKQWADALGYTVSKKRDKR
jgi:hypothetical protein